MAEDSRNLYGFEVVPTFIYKRDLEKILAMIEPGVTGNAENTEEWKWEIAEMIFTQLNF